MPRGFETEHKISPNSKIAREAIFFTDNHETANDRKITPPSIATDHMGLNTERLMKNKYYLFFCQIQKRVFVIFVEKYHTNRFY